MSLEVYSIRIKSSKSSPKPKCDIVDDDEDDAAWDS
jgi:hypothetical protein